MIFETTSHRRPRSSTIPCSFRHRSPDRYADLDGQHKFAVTFRECRGSSATASRRFCSDRRHCTRRSGHVCFERRWKRYRSHLKCRHVSMSRFSPSPRSSMANAACRHKGHWWTPVRTTEKRQDEGRDDRQELSLIHISEPTRLLSI